MKKEEIVYPKIKQLGYSDVMVSANYTGQESNIILEGQEQGRAMKQTQTVIGVGPHARRNSDRAGFVPGDKVLLDIDKINAERANGGKVRLITIPYNNKTGDVLLEVKKDGIKEADVSYGILLDPRSILMVLE